MTEYIQDYFKGVYEAYRIGNTETLYNAPIIRLLAHFCCAARNLSGGRKGAAEKKPDIKIWRGDVDITETEPFAKVEGIDSRAKAQDKRMLCFLVM